MTPPRSRKRPSGPRLGDKHPYRCPIHNGPGADATFRRNRDTGQPEWFASCFHASCRDLGGAYLSALARVVGAPSGGAIKADPLRWLAPLMQDASGGRAPKHAKPGRLPTAASIARWCSALESNGEAIAYLREERGLRISTIRKADIGYAPPGAADMPWGGFGAFTIPVYADGGLFNLRRRLWPKTPNRAGKRVKYVGVPGRPASLYPDVPAGRALLIVEGEFDALLARQYGFPAITSTAGTSWNPEWDTVVVGRRVAIAFDPEGYGLAQSHAVRFREAGAAQAWAVNLASAGLGPKEDLTDWFVRYRRSAASLRRLILEEREASF